MKRLLAYILLIFISIDLYAQEDITLFFLNDGSFRGFYNEEIDSLTYSHYDADSVWHSEMVMQDVWNNDTVSRIPLEMIDSITHQIPEPKYREGIIRLDDRYLPHITSVDGLNITFSSSLPYNLKPHIGDILLYEGSCEFFPYGFAGKVIMDGSTVVCEETGIEDIYERVVFFGCYALVDHEDGSHSARRISYREAKQAQKAVMKGDFSGGGGAGGGGSGAWGDDETGIEDWRMGDDITVSDLSVGTFKRAVKLKFNKIHTSVGADFSVTPILSLEFRYDWYLLNPVVFFKCRQRYNYTFKAQLAASLEWEPKDKNKEKPFWGENEPEWITINLQDMESDENDTEDSQSVMVIDEKVPIPEFPVLKVGFKLGLFAEFKAELEAVLGMNVSGTVERTFIYDLEKDNWISMSDNWKDYVIGWRYMTGKYIRIGTKQFGKGPTTCDVVDWSLEASGKLSAWAGLIAAGNVSIGINKNAEIKEELKLRFGPYVEGTINANLKDGIADKSMYQLLEGSKLKTGGKLGIDLKFSAKLKNKKLGIDCGFEDTQLSWAPKNLFWEKNLYLLPKFEAPTYSINGNTLQCNSKVSRVTLPNTIGFTLFREDGQVQEKKFQQVPYYYSDDKTPFSMSETFTGLDFKKHRYTIVPTTKLFGWNALEFNVHNEDQTCILCPDSNHPHLIDLGLPSGNMWLCSNVYASKPDEAGGYYQWGHPAQSLSCVESGYTIPNVEGTSLSGTSFDAATSNLGTQYVTPNKAQFEELLQHCALEIKGSDWYPISINSQEGLFLKGSNGNNLYLPFGGRMSETGIKGVFNDVGYYMLADYTPSGSMLLTSALKINGKEYETVPAKWYGYSVRPCSLVAVYDLRFSESTMDFQMIVGQDATQHLVLSNVGNTVISGSISQAKSPFHVDDSMVGDFRIERGQTLSIPVTFSPTEEGEYTSSFNIIYDDGYQTILKTIELKGIGLGHGSAETPEYVDLGLPSGTLWASRNLGAETTKELGGYYAWGETETKSSFSWKNYKYCRGASNTLTKYCTKSSYGYNNFTDSKVELEAMDDAATNSLGEACSIPTKAEWEELMTKANWYKFGDYVMIIGPNGASITLPMAGYRSGVNSYDVNTEGYYWSSTLDQQSPDDAWFLYMGTKPAGYEYYRSIGRSIRPVKHVGQQNGAKPRQATGAGKQTPVSIDLGDGMVVKSVSRSAESR